MLNGHAETAHHAALATSSLQPSVRNISLQPGQVCMDVRLHGSIAGPSPRTPRIIARASGHWAVDPCSGRIRPLSSLHAQATRVVARTSSRRPLAAQGGANKHGPRIGSLSDAAPPIGPATPSSAQRGLRSTWKEKPSMSPMSQASLSGPSIPAAGGGSGDAPKWQGRLHRHWGPGSPEQLHQPAQ